MQDQKKEKAAALRSTVQELKQVFISVSRKTPEVGTLWQLTFPACPWPPWECVCMNKTAGRGLVADPSTRTR